MNLHYTEEMLRLLSDIEFRKYQQRRDLSANARVLATADVLEEDSGIEIMGVEASI